MDEDTFDGIVRRLTSQPSRRHSLGLLGGLLTIPFLPHAVADAKKKKPCPPCKKRKKGKCKKRLVDGTACSGGSCQGGKCVPTTPATTTAIPCPSGQGRCGGACVDLRFDAGNCGACGRSCGAADCYNGVCTCAGTGAACPGDCSCEKSEGPYVCTSPNATDPGCLSSDQCPLGTVCLDGIFSCSQTCTG